MSQTSKLLPRFVNALLVAWLIVSAAVFAGALTLEMVFAAAVTLVISYFVLRRQRWGYFAAAAWGLAGYQLAKEGLALELVKRAAMLGGFAVVVAAIYLHEVYCRRPDEREESDPS